MQKFVTTFLLLCFVGQQSLASQEGVLNFSKFNIESRGIGSSGPVSVSGVRNADGEFSKLTVSFAGQEIEVPNDVSKHVPAHANVIQLSYLHFPDSQGGRTVFIVFQIGFTSETEPADKYVIAVSEGGNVSIPDYDQQAAQSAAGIPPFSPVDAASIVDDASLNARCTSLMDRDLPRTEIRYAVVTDSKEWGRVWRADLYSFSTGQMGRVVCWDPLEDPSDQVVHRAKYNDESDRPLPRQ